MTTQFDSIYSGLTALPGKLRIAPSGLGWKSSDEKLSVITVPAEDIKALHSIRVARNYQLKITTKNSVVTFDGFVKEDLERLTNVCKQYYNTTVEPKETTVKGWNWGEVEIQSQDLAFLVSAKPSFTIPLNLLSNTVLASKTEVVLDLNPNTASVVAMSKADEAAEDAIARKKRMRTLPDQVVEMRFFIPGSAKSKGLKKKERKVKAKKEEGEDAEMKDGEEKSSDDESEDEDDEEGESAAQAFFEALKERSDMGQEVGEALGTISDVLCMTPRGRFDIELYPEFLRLKGKTYDYRIAYSAVQKMFLLPKPDEIHSQLVINIDPPIRQGQTRYPYLVMQFINEEMLELDLNVEEETRVETYGEELRTHYDDPVYEVVTYLIRTLTKKKVTTPGNFQSKEGASAVKCMLKANEGHLYFLDKQLLFISKLPLLILFAEVSSVTFARSGGALPSSQKFDLVIKMKSTATTTENVMFTSVMKDELESIEEFLTMKKVRVKNEAEEVVAAAVVMALGSDDDEGDDDSDAAPRGKKSAGGDLREEDDEDSEVDEDFQAGSDSDSDSGDSASGGDDAMNVDDDSPAKAPEKKKQKTTS